MRIKLAVILVAAMLLTYVWVLGERALILLQEDSPVAVAIGLLLLAFPALAVFTLYFELRFGIRSQRLQLRASAEGVPELALEYRPSGRPTKESALQEFDHWQQLVASNSESWQAWLRLGEAYRANGDTVRARRAVAKAIKLERVQQS